MSMFTHNGRGLWMCLQLLLSSLFLHFQAFFKINQWCVDNWSIFFIISNFFFQCQHSGADIFAVRFEHTVVHQSLALEVVVVGDEYHSSPMLFFFHTANIGLGFWVKWVHLCRTMRKRPAGEKKRWLYRWNSPLNVCLTWSRMRTEMSLSFFQPSCWI